MDVLPDLDLLVGEESGVAGVPCSERDSNETRLTTDCLFRLRLGGTGRDMRRKGRWVADEEGNCVEGKSEVAEGKGTF
jgi:hypothetical protein